MKRSRGRNRRPGGNQQNAFNNPNRHFESVGPDVKIRGSAQQVLEKYQQYARDAHTSGDRVLSEAYFQYAEHYQRIVAKQTDARNQSRAASSNRTATTTGMATETGMVRATNVTRVATRTAIRAAAVTKTRTRVTTSRAKRKS